jgi:hypothetical protein
MKVLITDLTRMYDGHICAAGIDVDTGRRVRPVGRQRLAASMLASRGGVFDIGNVVELGRTRWQGSPPEVEDVLFDVRAPKVVKRLTRGEFFAALEKRLASGLDVIGADLVRDGRSLVTKQGCGRCSLVAIPWNDAIDVTLRSTRNQRGEIEQRIRFVMPDGIDLSVTDVRLYEADLITPNAERVRWLQGKLAEKPRAILCFGLGRPFGGKHYLQLNNLHLENALDWRLPP